MDSNPQSEAKASLTETLEALLASHVGVVEAARKISAARHSLKQESNPLFFPFVGIDSETDQFPLGPVRKHWETEALARYDQQRELAEQHYKPIAAAYAASLLMWLQSHAL